MALTIASHPNANRLPLVSVVMPARNVSDWISHAIQSVQMQSFGAWELLCIDNESSDDTSSILHAAADRDPRISLHSCATPGAWAARNLGIQLATARYICFLDADDLYPDSEVLGKLFLAMQDGGYMVSGGSLSLLYPNTSLSYPQGIGSQGFTFDADGYLHYSDYQFDFGYTRFLYQRSLLLNHDLEFPPYSRFEDPPFFVRTMLAANGFRAINCQTYLYRINHKPLVWTSQNLVDLLSGLTDNLSLSHQHNLNRLHNLTVERLSTEYEGAIRGGRFHGTSAVLHAEARCLFSIDRSVLNEREKQLLEKYYRQRLRSTLWGCLRQPRTIPLRFLTYWPGRRRTPGLTP